MLATFYNSAIHSREHAHAILSAVLHKRGRRETQHNHVAII